MRRILFAIIAVFLILFLAGFAHGQNVSRSATFAWQQPAAETSSGSFGGWKIYRKSMVGDTPAYALFATIPFVSQQAEYTTTQTISLQAGTQGSLVFVATAFDTAGNESGFSNEAVYNYDLMPPSVPTLFKLTVTITTN